MIVSTQPGTENDFTYYTGPCKGLNQGKKDKAPPVSLGCEAYPGSFPGPDCLADLAAGGYHATRQEQESGRRQVGGLEITYLESGSMPFQVGKGRYMLLPDTLSITCPGQKCQQDKLASGISRMHRLVLAVQVCRPQQEWQWPAWILLAPADLQQLSQALRRNEQPVFRANAAIRKCFGKMACLAQVSNPQSWIRIYVNELLLLLCELVKEQPVTCGQLLSEGLQAVEAFIEKLQESYGEHWTLAAMAAHTGLGITRFTYHFRQLTHQTPKQYLNALRLEAAARCLAANPCLPVNAICYDCGFTSTQYFATVFARHFGCSPSAYR